MKIAHLLVGRRAKDDGCELVDDATDPPPRVLLVARTKRSPGFGPSLAFPVAQWRRERRVGLIEAVPVTVAGPHRCCTGFRVSRPLQVVPRI
jgi:hypothetical protein